MCLRLQLLSELKRWVYLNFHISVQKQDQEPGVWKEYQLKLFFSADIVGSTAFKQKPGVDASVWFTAVLSFYHKAEIEFIRKWRHFQEQIEASVEVRAEWFGDEPEVWKTLGDEILFVKKITHPMQAFLAVQAWCLTLESIRAGFLEKDDYKGLDVKSSVWIADFPLKNREVVLGEARPNGEDDYVYINNKSLKAYYSTKSTQETKNLVRDFIGPSIDTGFRLGAFTSPRKLVISLELAYLLASEQFYAEINEKWHLLGVSRISHFIFRYEGRHILKGVMGGRPYPIFWIDLDAENHVHRTEEDLLSLDRPSAIKIRNFLEAILDEFCDYFSRPMFDASLRHTSENLAGFADIHNPISNEVSNKIEEYKNNIDESFRKRENELSDIASQDSESQEVVAGNNKVDADELKKKLRERLAKIRSDPS